MARNCSAVIQPLVLMLIKNMYMRFSSIYLIVKDHCLLKLLKAIIYQKSFQLNLIIKKSTYFFLSY